MPKLSKGGLDQVNKILENIKRTNTRGSSARKLLILVNEVIQRELIWDIEHNTLVTLQTLNKDPCLKVNFAELRKLGWSKEDETRKLKINDIDKLNDCITAEGVSLGTAGNFLSGKNVNENACRYFCRALNLPYRKVLEIPDVLNPIKDALKIFDHHEEFTRFSQLIEHDKKILVSYQHNGSYVPLNLWLRRCLNHDQNFNNTETLRIEIKFLVSQGSSIEREIIRQTQGKINWPALSQPQISQIGKELVRQILFKQNIVLVFDAKWPITNVLEFWQEFTSNLPQLKETDHCLLVLFVTDNNHSIPDKNKFYQINTPPTFDEDDISFWIGNQKVQSLLGLNEIAQIKQNKKGIWDNSQNGQPEALLEAIYKEFDNNNNWAKEKTEWHSLSN